MDNHEVYAKKELASWTERSGLSEQEQSLIEKYIKNEGRLIEAGTGGGRIALEIQKRYGRLEITAFDFVEEMIVSAKTKSDAIDFRVLDASDLSVFEDEYFDYAIYLQQIISLVPQELIPRVLGESYRIVKKDGIVIFSFLYFQGRKFNIPLSFMANTVRVMRGEKWEFQRLPWLKLGGRFNTGFLKKDQPTTYWFEENEIKSLLENLGFRIVDLKKDTMLYIVCQK